MMNISPKQDRLIHYCLNILLLSMLSIMCPGCLRVLEAAVDQQPVFDIDRPYFSVTRESIHEIVSSNKMTPILILDLPFEFVCDALIEVPWKGVNDILRPLAEWEKRRNEKNLYSLNLESLFEQGLKQKRFFLCPDDYLRVFKIKRSQGSEAIDVDRLVLSGQDNKEYLALYLDAIIRYDKEYGLVLLNRYPYLEHDMLPVYRYLLSHSLKPSNYREDCAIYYAVIHYVHSGKHEPQQLKLIKLLLKKGCNPNSIQAHSPYTSSIGGNEVNNLDSSIKYSIMASLDCDFWALGYNALDLACAYHEVLKRADPPDIKAIEATASLVKILRKHGAMHSKSWK